MSSPLHAFAQRGHVSDVVAGVPGVEVQVRLDGQRPHLRVRVDARELAITERTPEHHPAFMQGIHNRQRRGNREATVR